MDREHYFSLSLSAAYIEEAIYRRQLHYLLVLSEQGVSIRLPLQRLIPLIAKDGIYGRFCLRTGADNRFISLSRVD